ncbi:unnamed protein product [Ambrosiozyma monospora]|uniref:Unnamed protein product n=1 Tax=Ambrosiozyma monospora TaxID=43982 RepID=A0A9W6Z3U1_AMBMO|nr:unnamed protein product [Ambrosiozyma monospora]
MTQKKVSAFDRYKKSISFKEYKAQKEKSLEGELSEKKKKEEEEALRLKLETEETKRREAAEAEARAQAESEAQARAGGNQQQEDSQSIHLPPIQDQPPTATTTAAVTATANAPTAELPGIDPHQPPLPPVPTAADGEHPNGYHDPFGNDNSNNFEFDNNLLYGGGDDLMIPEDGNGADFGALDDQVFLMDGNMDGNME